LTCPRRSEYRLAVSGSVKREAEDVRRGRWIILAGVVGIGAIAATGGSVASAGPPGAHGGVKIQKALTCGADTGQPVVGRVKYSWDGTTLTVDISLRGAAPNNLYHVVLESTPDGGQSCGSSGLIADVTTDSSGNGRGSGSRSIGCAGSGSSAYLVGSSTAPLGEGVTSLTWTLPNVC
jgi:hypothetical protein